MKKAVSLKNLNFKFDNSLILNDVSFEIEQGKIVAIIGPNGSGKTTLLKNIIGAYQPSSGSVKVFDKDPERVVRHIGYVPQRFDFDRSIPISVYEFIALEKCGNQQHAPGRISEVLKSVGLANLEKSKLGELSGGQFQRVMIARALLHEKAILIFDEPATGVDIAGGRTIYDLIKKINQERKTTCLIVSHELSVVSRYADEVICLNKRVVCSGKPETVITPETLNNLYGTSIGLYHQHH